MRIRVPAWINVVLIGLALIAVVVAYGAFWTHGSSFVRGTGAPGTGWYLSRGASIGPRFGQTNQMLFYRVRNPQDRGSERAREMLAALKDETPQAKALTREARTARPSPQA